MKGSIKKAKWKRKNEILSSFKYLIRLYLTKIYNKYISYFKLIYIGTSTFFLLLLLLLFFHVFFSLFFYFPFVFEINYTIYIAKEYYVIVLTSTLLDIIVASLLLITGMPLASNDFKCPTILFNLIFSLIYFPLFLITLYLRYSMTRKSQLFILLIFDFWL